MRARLVTFHFQLRGLANEEDGSICASPREIGSPNVGASGRRGEELERDVVRVAERDTRPIVGVDDPTMLNA